MSNHGHTSEVILSQSKAALAIPPNNRLEFFKVQDWGTEELRLGDVVIASREREPKHRDHVLFDCDGQTHVGMMIATKDETGCVSHTFENDVCSYRLGSYISNVRCVVGIIRLM